MTDPTLRRRRRSLRRWAVAHARPLEWLYARFAGVLQATAPLVRLVPERVLETALGPVEGTFKGAVFGCRMCGECTLSETGMSCPMNCPKTLRNGPCGGVRPGGYCEVAPEMKCVWLDAWDGASRMAGGGIATAQPPRDGRRAGRSTWAAVIAGRHGPVSPPPAPDPAPPADRVPGDLERSLASGRFCVTTEFNPPDTADPGAIVAAAAPLLAACDSVNVTDGAGANTHISSISVCALLARDGHDPVAQISCRDRNRIAAQADALGAAALGIRNVLCLTGDGIGNGDQPGARPVFDLDCTTLLATLAGMRDRGAFASGRRIDAPPAFFLGATSNPCAVPPEVEVGRLAKKVAAGARFLQTQFCFDLDAFETFMARFRDGGLHERCRLLVGVGPLASANAARWMTSTIAGVRIPDAIVGRLESAADPRREGVEICIEHIERLRAVEGVAGVHIMAFRRPEAVAEIVDRLGLGRKSPERRATLQPVV